jgi:hypothetical protein
MKDLKKKRKKGLKESEKVFKWIKKREKSRNPIRIFYPTVSSKEREKDRKKE